MTIIEFIILIQPRPDTVTELADTINLARVTGSPPPKEPLLDSKVLITGFIAAAFTQLLVVVITWWRNKLDLNSKKNLILEDLAEKRKILVRLIVAYQILRDKFQKKDVRTHEYVSFSELNPDIFNAVSKPDVYRIFKKRMQDVCEIYNMITFLKAHDIEFTYTDYLNRINKHTQEMKDVENHEEFCSTHIGFIDRAISNIGKHIVAAESAISLIDKQLKISSPSYQPEPIKPTKQ